ncbi:AAA family ATPase [Myroides albus]|uniref:AAA family ATPase n=1 Tax=Myroides albus TaxID=2562892 RepID=UPI002158DB79|nr:AAA family ATPase [Myroides albus]UVD80104.1 AAA family ATPase [Myroides albus]
MYLEEIVIINYKSCKVVDFKLKENNPNIFIGLNDCGKSTLLKGIELLFNRVNCSFSQEGNNKSDLSNSTLALEEFESIFQERNLPCFDEYDNTSIYVLGKLRLQENELDSFENIDFSNSLSWMLENLIDNSIWLIKKINANTVTGYLAQNSNIEYKHIYTETAAKLNTIKKELNITSDDIINSNATGRFSNLELIRAINSKIELERLWIEYKPAKKDSDIFPEYKYFDWNCSMEEVISIATGLMKDKIEEFIQPIKTTAQEKAHLAEEAINEEFNRIQKIISSVAPEIQSITSKIHFEVKEKVSDIMVQKLQSDGLIHLDNQGEGLKRKIWFSLIKAKAESTDQLGIKKHIWAFDEPETHLYPGAQREFFDILKGLSRGNVQTLISTHSTIFIDKANTNDILNTYKLESGYTNLSSCDSVESIFESLKVKNSDFLFHDKFLIVEGDTEQYIIPALYKIYTGRTFIEDNIQLINIEGKDKWRLNKGVLKSITQGFNKIEDSMILLFDNDMSFEMDAIDKTENVFFVGKQDIEDSIAVNLWTDIVNQFYDGLFEVDEAFIQKVFDSIPEGAGIQSNKKFFKKLSSSLKTKWMEDGNEIDDFISIPDKGNESSDFILKVVNHRDHIPSKIKEAFDKLIALN